MSTITVTSISSLNASFSVPGDKSISHRAAILAGLAEGKSTITNFLPSEDCLNTLHAMKAVGAQVRVIEESDLGPTGIEVIGVKMEPQSSVAPIDCGNSGTGMRLLAGVLAAQPFESVLIGDESLSGRPMGRIMTPLAKMGAILKAEGEKEGCAPLRVSGENLHPIHYDLPMASAQVKSAIMLAGLFADGETSVTQPAQTRDHTERIFEEFGLRVGVEGLKVTVPGGQTPRGTDLLVPGDISSAAFWLVAAAAIPDSRLVIENVGLNPTRDAIIKVLLRMGAEIQDSNRSGAERGEPVGNVLVNGRGLVGTEILKEEVPNLIDEVPIIAVAGALAQGKTTIRNAKELRVKETDRISTVVEGLRKMGVEVEEFEDGMEITGGASLKAAEIESHGDHRIAMAFAIAGLFAKGTTKIHGCDCINTSYPGFKNHLEEICG